VVEAYRTVRAELEAYGHELADKPEIVAINKIDAIDPADLADRDAALRRDSGCDVLHLSGVSGEGAEIVRRTLLKVINEARNPSDDGDGGPYQP